MEVISYFSLFIFDIWCEFLIKTIILFVPVGYEMIIANSAIRAPFAIHHLVKARIQRVLVEFRIIV